MKLFFDLETIQTQSEILINDIAATITHPKAMKKADTIKNWEITQKQGAIDLAVSKTVFDGGQGEIISFGYAIDDEEPQVIQRNESMTEYMLLHEVYKVLSKLKMPPLWVGHNICGFDLRYLWKRSIVNQCSLGVKIPYDTKPWGSNVYDTMYEWAGTGNDKKSLDFVCKALNLKGKSGMDGSKVYQAWKDKEYEKIGDYCKHDVAITREVYKRLTFGE